MVIIAPGSSTHHSDMTARFVQLAIAPFDVPQSTHQRTDGELALKPNDGSVPRGFYMMFVFNSSGVPSVASWIKVE